MNDDFIASELLSELKSENQRKSKLIHSLIKVIVGLGAVVVIIVISFLFYLYQYDFTSTETLTTTNTAEGVYAIIDSEGNVITNDLTPEELEKIMEVNTDGSSDSNSNEDSNKVQN